MEIPRHWRLKQQRYGLVGEICPRCDTKSLAPRGACVGCESEGSEGEGLIEETGADVPDSTLEIAAAGVGLVEALAE